MSEALTQDIQDAINKNLSAQVATVLRTRLESVDRLEANAKVDHETIRELRVARTTQDATIAALNERINGYVARETEFRKSEQQVAAARLAEATSKAQLEGAMEVTRLVFANNIVKRRVNGIQPVASANPNQYNNNTVSTEETLDG